MGDRVTFDDCIPNSHSQDCDPRKLWLQVILEMTPTKLLFCHQSKVMILAQSFNNALSRVALKHITSIISVEFCGVSQFCLNCCF